MGQGTKATPKGNTYSMNMFSAVRDYGDDYPMWAKQRRTLVKEEKWPLVDGWYWCPESLYKKRMEKLRVTYPHYDFTYWEKDAASLEQRLAHRCKDGRIRAGSGIQPYKKKSGIVSLYGRCHKCNVRLSDGIKAIILMETAL